MIVIDASLIAKYVIREENWDNLEHYLLYNDVISVDFMLKEVLNPIRKSSRKTRHKYDLHTIKSKNTYLIHPSRLSTFTNSWKLCGERIT